MPRAKPTAARTAAVRAQNGDLGAQLELIAKHGLSFTQCLVLGAVLAALAGAGVGAWMVFGSKIKRLRPNDSAGLKAAFLSGEPWLVECTADGRAGPALSAAETEVDKSIGLATLDCGAKLASGKSTYERFKVSAPSSRGPVLLFAANLDKPVVVPRDKLYTGASLATWANAAAKPRLITIGKPEDFEAGCTRRRWCCVVYTKEGRPNKVERAALTAIAGASRTVRFVTFDSRLLDLKFAALDIPAPTATSSVMILLKGADQDASGTGAAMIIDAPIVEPRNASDAIANAMARAPLGFTQFQQAEAVTSTLPPPTPPQQRTYERSEPEPRSKTFTDAELKARRAELEAERERMEREREAARREEMEAEEAGLLLESNDDDDAPAADEGDAEEVEVEDFD